MCSVVLEVVTNYDLWIWHAFFGMTGAHNDINVLQRSSVSTGLADGQAPECNYVMYGHYYDKGYYLADVIYPTYSTIFKTICQPCWCGKEESAQKDVKRALGVLQAGLRLSRTRLYHGRYNICGRS